MATNNNEWVNLFAIGSLYINIRSIITFQLNLLWTEKRLLASLLGTIPTLANNGYLFHISRPPTPIWKIFVGETSLAVNFVPKSLEMISFVFKLVAVYVGLMKILVSLTHSDRIQLSRISNFVCSEIVYFQFGCELTEFNSPEKILADACNLSSIWTNNITEKKNDFIKKYSWFYKYMYSSKNIVD